jgi:hypothetical protein
MEVDRTQVLHKCSGSICRTSVQLVSLNPENKVEKVIDFCCC